MRGTEKTEKEIESILRITPAYAGNSLVREGRLWKRVGSPPHMRGTDFGRSVLGADPGITPAYAGNSD